jgi:intracellular sulfur oxidation DsrE/DsrF family protein
MMVMSYLLVLSAMAQTSLAIDSPSYIARIELHTAEELYAVLVRSDQLLQISQQLPVTPVAFILHGPEARVFFRDQYQQNQELVDLAAKLSAFNVVDIQVCKTWMGSKGLDEGQLLPFVGTVPFGPAEEQRLIRRQSYRYF